MTERIVVIGADAAGMSAASQAKRIAGDAVEIVAFERGAYSSFSACGIPYWVAGDVDVTVVDQAAQDPLGADRRRLNPGRRGRPGPRGTAGHRARPGGRPAAGRSRWPAR
jgi:NADPH-dependent 2,4-dienoyl-CoA reductase/sulfur reductase-like enzyme